MRGACLFELRGEIGLTLSELIALACHLRQLSLERITRGLDVGELRCELGLALGQAFITLFEFGRR